MPFSIISGALNARYLSVRKDLRQKLGRHYAASGINKSVDEDQLFDAYQFARFLNHYQGFSLIRAASVANNWSIDLQKVAKVWSAGCIIQSLLLHELLPFLSKDNDILDDRKLTDRLNKKYIAAQKVVGLSLLKGLPLPCFVAAVTFWNGLRQSNGTASLIQAQRDYFGAHGLKILIDGEERSINHKWTGANGT